MQFPCFLLPFVQIVLVSRTQVVLMSRAYRTLGNKENQIHGIQEVNSLTRPITLQLATHSVLVGLQVLTAYLKKTLMYHLSLFLTIIIFLTWSKGM